MNDFAPQQENNNSSNNKQDMSYFGAMRHRYANAPNFIWYLKPEQIQKSAKERIFKEMIRGQIDYAQNGQYFQDPKFLDNVIIAARDELNNNTIIRDALKYTDMCFPGDLNRITLLSRYESLVVVFNEIYNRLYRLKFSGNIGELADLQYIMGSYRNLL